MEKTENKLPDYFETMYALEAEERKDEARGDTKKAAESMKAILPQKSRNEKQIFEALIELIEKSGYGLRSTEVSLAVPMSPKMEDQEKILECWCGAVSEFHTLDSCGEFSAVLQSTGFARKYVILKFEAAV